MCLIQPIHVRLFPFYGLYQDITRQGLVCSGNRRRRHHNITWACSQKREWGIKLVISCPPASPKWVVAAMHWTSLRLWYPIRGLPLIRHDGYLLLCQSTTSAALPFSLHKHSLPSRARLARRVLPSIMTSFTKHILKLNLSCKNEWQVCAVSKPLSFDLVPCKAFFFFFFFFAQAWFWTCQ